MLITRERVFRNQKQFEQAEHWIRHAMVHRQKSLGLMDPYMFKSYSHLSTVLTLLGRSEESKDMNRRALSGFEEVIGREHIGHYSDWTIWPYCFGRLGGTRRRKNIRPGLCRV